ncbi:hypothetical protein ARMGADRAFT_1084890 [Armillaria gallica]|uniref:Ribosome recycling factor domain-containing protein n=1 Tax=Armillaria gallica TaxID=47427 RepID=A0A2H3DJ28_ARMGA|nr:hypothetical protein ARMGADRAFT_1084890 [Armillaria gallica]
MLTDSISATKRIRRCFFFSAAFVIMVPAICIILAVTLHPREFEYRTPSVDNGNRTISLHADLISADLKQGSVVLDWSILNDTCYLTADNCSNANIYFATNLLQQFNTNSSKPSDNNRPTDPTFIWNITSDIYDDYTDFPMFQTVVAIFNPFSLDDGSHSKYPISHSHRSNVYYPFDRYTAVVFCFAEDTSTNSPVKLHLQDSSGLVGGLKITATVADPSEFSDDDFPELVFIQITLQRGTLVVCYCIVITITFWLITLTICLLMIMTVGFGFRQRNEIVVVPIGTVFAFTQLRSTMPGAPDGFGDILDFVGVLPCLVLLSICAITMVGIYIFTDPAKDSREQLNWSALVKPGSRQSLTKRADIAEHEKCEDKLKALVEWPRRDCADASARAAGRVMSALLANVRVKEQKLEEEATVGVRDGSMLVVTVFDEENLKHVEAVIYDAKIASVTPQRQDTNIENPWKKAEDTRVQCRRLHQASVKKGEYDKRSIELQFQDLLDKHIADIDKIVADMKKTLGLAR